MKKNLFLISFLCVISFACEELGCSDCGPTTKRIFSIQNATSNSLQMTFYSSLTDTESQVIASGATLVAHSRSVDGELDGFTSIVPYGYDSAKIYQNDILLEAFYQPSNCSSIRDLLCEENYELIRDEVTSSGNTIKEYRLTIDD
jgi:hypothetical protein